MDHLFICILFTGQNISNFINFKIIAGLEMVYKYKYNPPSMNWRKQHRNQNSLEGLFC